MDLSGGMMDKNIDLEGCEAIRCALERCSASTRLVFLNVQGNGIQHSMSHLGASRYHTMSNWLQTKIEVLT